MYRLSIIMPAHNSTKHISQALETILIQQVQGVELLIVDDGSTDGTKEVIQKYVNQCPGKIRYFYQENKGAGAARNKGIKEAKGDYICFLDSDDLYTPDSLKLRIDALESDKSDIVIGKRRKIIQKGTQGFTDNMFTKKYRSAIINHNGNRYLCDSQRFFNLALDKGLFVDTNSIMFNKEFLLSIGLFDEKLRISQDIDLWFRAFFAAKRFIYIDDVLSITRHYLNRHAKDLEKLFYYERKRYFKQIRLLNANGFDKRMIKVLERRICAKKYRIKGILEYRKGNNIKALKYYFKALRIYKEKETAGLILKALIPKTISIKLKQMKTSLAGAK